MSDRPDVPHDLSYRTTMTPTLSAPPKRLPWLLIALLVMALDQLTKQLIVAQFALGGQQVITSFFNLVRWHNPGAAFSFLADSAGWQRWFFTVLSASASLFIVWLLGRPGQSQSTRAALALILGGAVGNLIDRCVYGYVIDFIQVHWAGWSFPAFNIADSAISVGAVVLIADEIFGRKPDKKITA
jgi:signal peptidase II